MNNTIKGWVFSALLIAIVIVAAQFVPTLAVVVWLSPLILGLFAPRMTSPLGFSLGAALVIVVQSKNYPVFGRDILGIIVMCVALGVIAAMSQRLGLVLQRENR